MSLNVTQKIGAVLFIPALGALVATMIFYGFLVKTRSDTTFTNIAGRQRMLSEQMNGEVSRISTGIVIHAEDLKKLGSHFEDALQVMEFGGVINGRTVSSIDHSIIIPLHEVKAIWTEVRPDLYLLSSGNRPQKASPQFYVLTKQKLLKLRDASDRLVSSHEKLSGRLRQRMLIILTAIAVFDIFIFLAGFWAIREHLLERKASSDALIKSEQDWRKTFDSITDFVSIHDKDHRIVRANKALESFVGVEAGQLVGKYCHEIFYCGTEPIDNCPHSKTLSTNREYTIEYNEPRIGFPLEISTYPIVDENGETTASVHVAKNISDQKKAEAELNNLAHYDQLTGLPNRTLFFKALNRSIKETASSARMTAIMFIDLDQFKIINDSLGHETGDRVLKLVGQRLSDTVRGGDLVARLGGDEFAIILVNLAQKEDILTVAEKIVGGMAEPFKVASREFFLTTSIGISLYPEDGENAESLLRNADISMYRAKEQGRNNYQFYSSAMGKVAPRRLALETELQHALQRNQFEVYYQPKVNLGSGNIVGMEALLRWNHPTLGRISPDEFIFLLEETGLIVDVGAWVLQTACRQTKTLQESGFPFMTVNVNVSARQFRHKNLCDVVTRALDDSELSPGSLELELTESVLVDRVEEAAGYLSSLKALNIRIALDDFGTGYSSLSYLKRFPLDTLKIDRSFIKDVTSDPDAASIVKNVISLARDLRMSVVAEGVETKEQLYFMAKHDCDEIQGFYFSKPIPFESFKTLLANHRPLLRVV